MSGYTKLFQDIVTSTVWQIPNDGRVLWVTILALKDKNHICRATVPALAKLCDITIRKCEEYLRQFQSPDKHSRSQAHEGRRIKAVDGGWLVLNGQKYNDMYRSTERTEYMREAKRKSREKQRLIGSVNKSTKSTKINHSSPSISPAPDTSISGVCVSPVNPAEPAPPAPPTHTLDQSFFEEQP